MSRPFLIVGGIVILGVLLFANVGLGPASSLIPGAQSSAVPSVLESGVPWQDYASDTKARIDAMVGLRDCSDLKRVLNAAVKTNDATAARTGHDNSELIAYINAAMQSAGCGG